MVIGIAVRILYEEGSAKEFVNPSVVQYAREGGFVPLLLPTSSREDAFSFCDAFLLPGGLDIDPDCYGSSKREHLQLVDPSVDRLDRRIVSYAIRERKPVLGICRGLQSINAFTGGTLCEVGSAHLRSDSEEARLLPETAFFHRVYPERFRINSYHHQGIGRLSPLLRAAALSAGVIEAVEGKEFPLIGVQWHPELMKDAAQRSLIGHFREWIENGGYRKENVRY